MLHRAASLGLVVLFAAPLVALSARGSPGDAASPECARFAQQGRAAKPFVANLAEAARKNTDFRRVLHTGERTQLVVMRLAPGQDIGAETHPHVEQTITIVEGRGAAVIGDWSALSIPEDAMVFARTAFGDLFFLHAGDVACLDVRYGRMRQLGPSAYIFLCVTVAGSTFQQRTLERRLFEAVRRRVGELAADECYGLFPAPGLGGNPDDAKAYKRVKLREYLAMLSQT
jgi:hypothetical protein